MANPGRTSVRVAYLRRRAGNDPHMETLLLVLIAIIVTALVVWNLPRLRAQAAARRVRPRGGCLLYTSDAADE